MLGGGKSLCVHFLFQSGCTLQYIQTRDNCKIININLVFYVEREKFPPGCQASVADSRTVSMSGASALVSCTEGRIDKVDNWQCELDYTSNQVRQAK
jgi:hypothetical protein